MKRILFIILCGLALLPAVAQTKTTATTTAKTTAASTSSKDLTAAEAASQALSAKQVAQKFIDKVSQQTLVTDFNVTVTENASQPTVYKGNIRMRGERFRLNAFGQEAAYDGKTLYMYADDTNELTLSNPTQEELLDANPVLFAKALMLQAQLRFSPSNKKTDVYSVDFIPNNQSAGIQRFVLVLRKSDFIPLSITIKEGKKSTKLTFSNAKYDSAAPSCTIKKQGAYINDLR